MNEPFSFEHTFFRTSIIGFIDALDRLFEPYAKQHLKNNQKFPIFINSVGDEVYMSNLTSIGEKQVELYDYNPRMSLSFGGISIEQDQLTAFAVVGRTQVKNASNQKIDVLTHLRRMPIKLLLKAEIVFHKLSEMLEFIEYYLHATSHLGMGFEFMHAGCVHQATFGYAWEMDPSINFGLEFSSEKREVRVPITFEVNVQFPAHNFYESKGFTYYEQPGVFNEYSNTSRNANSSNHHSDDNDCNGDDFAGAIKWVHKLHVNNTSDAGIVSVTTVPKDKLLEIPKSDFTND